MTNLIAPWLLVISSSSFCFSIIDKFIYFFLLHYFRRTVSEILFATKKTYFFRSAVTGSYSNNFLVCPFESKVPILVTDPQVYTLLLFSYRNNSITNTQNQPKLKKSKLKKNANWPENSTHVHFYYYVLDWILFDSEIFDWLQEKSVTLRISSAWKQYRCRRAEQTVHLFPAAFMKPHNAL